MAEEFVLPDFLQENTDVDTIHARMMDMLPNDIDKTEGGFPWDFTRPTALMSAELLQFYIPEIIKLMFPQWSTGKFLDYLAVMAQIERKPSTYAMAKLQITGDPGTIIEQGEIFATESANGAASVEFATVESVEIDETGKAEVSVQAVAPGTESNVNPGTIVLMSEPISGVISVTNTGRATGGAAEESDDELRERILAANTKQDISYVGNNADYKRWAEEVAGIGTAIVLPEWDGPGTVKLVCIDTNGEAANQFLLDAVYTHIMAPKNPLERLAPIGATLTVTAPEVIDIRYAFKVVMKDGCNIEDIENSFRASMIAEHKKAKAEGVLKYSHIFALIAGIDEVYDLLELTINDGKANISLSEGQYLRIQEVTITTEGDAQNE